MYTTLFIYISNKMNLSIKGFSTNEDSKLNTSNKITTLNPNAVEFVPLALRSSSGNTKKTDATRVDATGTSGKAVLDRLESSASNNSDDGVHQYWNHQLPDDITPDFNSTGDEELQGPVSVPVANLSMHDGIGTSLFSASTSNGQLLSKRHNISSHIGDGINLNEKMRYSFPTYAEDQSSGTFLNLPTIPWDEQFVNGDLHCANGREGHPNNGDSSADFLNELFSERAVLDDNEINPVEFLASQFPGFAAESVADVYYANGCDLNLTIELLIQLELQIDVGFNQNLSSTTPSAPNLSELDFPALTDQDAQNGLPLDGGDDLQQTAIPYRYANKDIFLFFKSNSSGTSRGAIDFASVVRKIAPQDSNQLERNGSENVHFGTSKRSQPLASTYSGHGKSYYGDRLQSYGAARAAPVWLETGESVANMYSNLREEARDHARLRNIYFEQARQAYLTGNKALAKKLSVEGQLHNMQMKAAHGKAKDSIYRQRNSMEPELLSKGKGRERMIDLHGLHVSEAIQTLKQELSTLRSSARSTVQRLQVLICVGTGHHTKGSRTPARLPVAVKRFLQEEEGLEYTEPQPGLLRVLIY
ncbi:polyadenylate-binding protein-interacting protein 7-like [Tasmannia lanceolata]|uniref:polyadenylate-binding protein-interacting protein 7-like n=1 Tax=Tasmannia lanceolata TaxID=3420 RepID=UPI004064141C